MVTPHTHKTHCVKQANKYILTQVTITNDECIKRNTNAIPGLHNKKSV